MKKIIYLYLILPLMLLGIGCDGPAPIQENVYEARGVITTLHVPSRRVGILHESIPSFRNEKGDVVGMDPMNMVFAVADSVDMTSWEKGNKLSFQFQVDWYGSPRITLIEGGLLAPEVELNLNGYSVE